MYRARKPFDSQSRDAASTKSASTRELHVRCVFFEVKLLAKIQIWDWWWDRLDLYFALRETFLGRAVQLGPGRVSCFLPHNITARIDHLSW